ncbi:MULTISPECIES: hypothetical protein [Nostocales]|uniref:hypothetical protein n=1 Tax=Nostocales TaxID=1161 RepID=UPI000ADE3F0B
MPELHYVPFRQISDWLRWLEQNTHAIAKQGTASQPSQKADRIAIAIQFRYDSFDIKVETVNYLTNTK